MLNHTDRITFVYFPGCLYNGQCIPFGKSYTNMQSCATFTCVRKGGKPAFVDRPYGKQTFV